MYVRGAIGLLCAGAWLTAGSAAMADEWSLTRKRPAPRAPRPAAEAGDAVARHARSLRQNPADAVSLERLVAALASEGGLASFVEEWVRESAQQPGDALLAEASARLLARSGQTERAALLLRHFGPEGACAVGPMLFRSELLAGAGDVSGADTLRRAALACARLPAARRRAGEALGKSLLAQGDLAAARAVFDALLADTPGDAAVQRKWPEALAQHGYAREAADAYLALSGGRADVALLRDAALEYIKVGDMAAARAAFSRAGRQASRSQRAELSALEEQAHRAAGQTAELAQRLAGSSDATERVRAAELWDELGDDARAEALYQGRLARSPGDLEVLERLARLYVRMGKRAQAAVMYRRLVLARPADVARLGEYAELLRTLGREQELPALLERAARLAAHDAAAQRALAELHARLGQPAAHKQALLRLVQLEPREAAHVVALGELLLEQGEREAALATWRGLAARDPVRARGLATLADVLGDHDVLDEAIATMERALELEPEQLGLRRKHASLLERAGRAQAAEHAWRWVLARAAQDAEAGREARAHLVSLWKRLGVVPMRARELAEQLRGDPKDHATLRLLAELFARDPKRADGELPLIDRMAGWGQADPETLRALAALHGRRGDPERALPLLERLAERSPDNALDYLGRAVELALAQYRDADAERYARRAVALRPTDAAAHRLLGHLHARRQELDLAAAAYARAAELEPRDIATWVRVSELAEARADSEVALSAWLKVIEHAADDEQVAVAARKLMAVDGGAARGLLEARLLEGLRVAPRRDTFRRLLVESYGRTFLSTPRTTAPAASRMALRPLLETLSDDDAGLRHTSISLLSAARARSAAMPLLAHVEHSGSRAERARALVAIGHIAEPSVAPRLRTLLPRLPAPLKAIGLWALVATLGPAAQDDALALLGDAGAGVRAVAALALGSFEGAAARPVLRLLVDRERNPGVRAAALWSLSAVVAPEERELFLDALEAPWPVPAAALWGLRGDGQLLALALFDADERVQRVAAELWDSGQHVLTQRALAPPSWPFETTAYVTAQLAGFPGAAKFSSRQLSSRDGHQVGAALATLLERGGPAAAQALSGLSGTALTPRALAERGFCASQAFSSALLQAAGPALGRQASQARDPLGTRALLLLARSSDSVHPAVLRALAPKADAASRSALLEVLADRPHLPEGLGAPLLHLFDVAQDWPTRLRVAEVLGARLGPKRERDEPVALVRAAILVGSPASRGGFCGPDSAAN